MPTNSSPKTRTTPSRETLAPSISDTIQIYKRMRRLILLFITLTKISCSGQSGDELIFKVQYKPETKYSQTIVRTSNSNVKYSGSEEFHQKLKEKGIQNPMIIDKETTIESILKTGKLSDDSTFPLTVEFVKTTGSANKSDIPDGAIIYGHGSIDSMPTLDSIVSPGLDDEFEKVLLQTMQSTYSQLLFPEQRVKIGDGFSRVAPLSFPIAGEIIEMTITTDYKLLSITNGIADFDVSQVYIVKSTSTKYPVKASGSGKGKLLYDVSNKFYLKYQIDIEIALNLKLEMFDLDSKSRSGFTQTTVITTN